VPFAWTTLNRGTDQLAEGVVAVVASGTGVGVASETVAGVALETVAGVVVAVDGVATEAGGVLVEAGVVHHEVVQQRMEVSPPSRARRLHSKRPPFPLVPLGLECSALC